MCTNSDFTNCLSYFEIIKKCIFFSNKMFLECKICTEISLFVFIYTFENKFANRKLEKKGGGKSVSRALISIYIGSTHAI